MGTKIFSSPEQSTSSSYDHRTDIYSLGIIIGMLFSTWKTKHEEFELINKSGVGAPGTSTSTLESFL